MHTIRQTFAIALFAGLTILGSAPAVRAAMGGAFNAAMAASMQRMDRAMAAAPMTGNADLDFAAMMIPHHQGAIDMAQVELVYGHDRRLKRLAQEIIITQKSEIQVMTLVRRDLHPR